MLERAIGEVDGPPESRFDARRRARGAVSAAEALLRSEAYYQPVLEDIVEGEERPTAIVSVEPGRRFVLTPLAEVAPERCPPGWDQLLPPSGVHPRGPLE